MIPDTIIDGEARIIEVPRRKGKKKSYAEIVYGGIKPEERFRQHIEAGNEPWGRMQGENSKAYRGFIIFRDMGVGRSTGEAIERLRAEGLVRGPGKVDKRSHFNVWSLKWCWRMRAEAWDDHLIKLEEADWLEKQKLLRSRDWEASEKLFKTGMDALEGVSVEDLSAKDIARFLGLASELGKRTRREPVTREFIQQFVGSLPEGLRVRVVELLQLPTGQVKDAK